MVTYYIIPTFPVLYLRIIVTKYRCADKETYIYIQVPHLAAKRDANYEASFFLWISSRVLILKESWLNFHFQSTDK